MEFLGLEGAKECFQLLQGHVASSTWVAKLELLLKNLAWTKVGAVVGQGTRRGRQGAGGARVGPRPYHAMALRGVLSESFRRSENIVLR